MILKNKVKGKNVRKVKELTDWYIYMFSVKQSKK